MVIGSIGALGPYPGQAIQQLFVRYVSNDPLRLYEMTSSMRHALSHGDQLERVEKEYSLTLVKLVDLVAGYPRPTLEWCQFWCQFNLQVVAVQRRTARKRQRKSLRISNTRRFMQPGAATGERLRRPMLR